MQEIGQIPLPLFFLYLLRDHYLFHKSHAWADSCNMPKILHFNFLSRLLSPHHRQASKRIDSFCCSARFISLHTCVYARLFVRARLRSLDGYPSLAVFCGTLASSAIHTAALAFLVPLTRVQWEWNTNLRHLCLVLYPQNTSGMESQNLVDDLSPKKNTVLKVCSF